MFTITYDKTYNTKIMVGYFTLAKDYIYNFTASTCPIIFPILANLMVTEFLNFYLSIKKKFLWMALCHSFSLKKRSLVCSS